jgi:hypothetical protein
VLLSVDGLLSIVAVVTINVEVELIIVVVVTTLKK